MAFRNSKEPLDFIESSTEVDFTEAMKIVYGVLESASADGGSIEGVTLMVATDDGSFTSCEIFREECGASKPNMLAFIARLVTIKDRLEGQPPSARRTIN